MRSVQIDHRTDIGRVRSNNEDAVACDPAVPVAVLADGMGGLDAGEVAAHVAVHTVLEYCAASQRSAQELSVAVVAANGEVHALNALRKNQRMGTTVVAWLGLSDDRCAVAHVGDSRAYLWRNEHLTRITSDHSMVQQLVEAGMMTEAQAARSPNRNIVTRALGLDEAVEVDLIEHDWLPGDRWLLCSDGLTDLVSNAEIARRFRDNPSPDRLLQTLINTANELGGNDNIAVVLIS